MEARFMGDFVKLRHNLFDGTTCGWFAFSVRRKFKFISYRLDELGRWLVRRTCCGFGSLFIAMVGYFFLASVYAAFLGLFLDSALDAVQQEHYPDSVWEKPPGLLESSISSLRFILWSLVIYLICSPLLLVAFFIPPLGLLLQILLGGYLLGREFGQIIEHRIPRELRIRKPGKLVHGAIASFFWMFPLLNFIAPMLLAASLVHARLRQL